MPRINRDVVEAFQEVRNEANWVNTEFTRVLQEQLNRIRDQAQRDQQQFLNAELGVDPGQWGPLEVPPPIQQDVGQVAPTPRFHEDDYMPRAYRIIFTYNLKDGIYTAWNRKYGIVVEGKDLEEMKKEITDKMIIANENNDWGLSNKYDIRYHDEEEI